MYKNQYWEEVNYTKFHEVLIFFSIIALGIIIYELTDFLFIEWISANFTSFWFNFLGYPFSPVIVLNGHVVLQPTGVPGYSWSFNQTSTPSAGIYPFLCLLAVPHSRWSVKLRVYFIFFTLLFAITSLVTAIEFDTYMRGLPSGLNNVFINQFIMYGGGAIALTVLFIAWPEATVPFVYPVNLIVNGIRKFVNHNKDPGSEMAYKPDEDRSYDIWLSKEH